MGFLDFFFEQSRIQGNELQECLDCYEAENKVTAFQTKEADLFNDALVKYGNSITENPLAASEACKAAKRLSQAATEILRRHKEIRNVPVAASRMHYAWYVTFLAYATWVSAAAKGIEATAEGMKPNTMYLQQLVREHEKYWRRAQDEEKKFLKCLKVSAEDVAKIVTRAIEDTANDDWEPKMADEDSSCAKGLGASAEGLSQIALIKDSEWSVIDGQPCRVSDFSPLGSFIDAGGEVVSADRTTPYAFITMECKKLGKNIRGYISHKMDFQHLWAAFKERTVKEDEEVIILWTKTHYKGAAKFTSAFMPRLWVMVCPKGAFELMTDSDYKPELTGLARWNAMKPIIDWKPEVME